MLKHYLFSIAFLSLFLSRSAAQEHRIDLDPAMRPFYHGVESGDPMADRIIIWTRVTPDTGMTGDIDVHWQIATDTNFTNIVNFGTVTATEANHYCAKVDVCGLQGGTYYYYMFNALHRNSIMGRTKTAPAAGADVDSLRFAVVSCASWEHGYFNGYQSISNRNDVDAVVHLGDYVYEYESGGFSGAVAGRTYDPPTECITEVGYELRYSQYKLDKQVQRIHQLYPFITVWDDHETANNSWKGGAQNHTPGTEGSWEDRKRNGTSTYFKWMPLRKPDPLDTLRIFRTLRYGKLLDLVMVDTRLYDRDEPDLGATNDSSHTLMGPVELAWFLQQLSDTTTRWKIIGNQIMFAPLEVFGQPVNSDQWDGYNYERQVIQNHIMNNNIKDVVVLTGDIHTSWCNDVPGPNYNDNTGAGSVCVEFVGPSITSASSPLPVGESIIQALNPHMKYVEISKKGYYILDVRKTQTQADYVYMSTVSSMTATDQQGASFLVRDNERFLRSTNPIYNFPKITAPLPPLAAKQNINVARIEDHSVTIPENTQTSVNILPNLQACPGFTLNTIDDANNGVAFSLNGRDVSYTPSNNYHGEDTVVFTVCTNEATPVCDTVYLFVTVLSIRDIDTITVDLNPDTVHQTCITFDDLRAEPVTINVSQDVHGTTNLVGTCFMYIADTAFCGIDYVTFTTCDTTGECDTIVYKFKVNNPLIAATVELQLNKNTNLTQCLYFDDLMCAAMNVQIIKNPAHGTFQKQGDTCVKYFPHFNYVGDDTMRFTGCDTCGPNSCDTLTLVFHTVEPSAVQEVSSLVVFGMFPNPVGDKLIVQYYAYDAAAVAFNVYDIAGRRISTDSYFSNTGLQYAQLDMTTLPVGDYIVEVRLGESIYRKKVIKQ